LLTLIKNKFPPDLESRKALAIGIVLGLSLLGFFPFTYTIAFIVVFCEKLMIYTKQDKLIYRLEFKSYISKINYRHSFNKKLDKITKYHENYNVIVYG
jgi:uncharacterized membrane protein